MSDITEHKANIHLLALGLKALDVRRGRSLTDAEIKHTMFKWKRDVVGEPWNPQDEAFLLRVLDGRK